jgi:hypothetical protein
VTIFSILWKQQQNSLKMKRAYIAEGMQRLDEKVLHVNGFAEFYEGIHQMKRNI